MPFELLTGPPASGKTARALHRARAAARDGQRVWWVGLPSQRAYVYRRATEQGGILGLEFLTVQQVAYRLLADALRLRPLVVGTERLVLVGEALADVAGELPAPGEARLFAMAIAEAKRFRLAPGDVPVHDAVTERLRDVFRAYQRRKGEAWDYDDFRSAALDLAREEDGDLEADLLVVDGMREVGPLDLELYRALGHRTEVLLCLPEAPPATQADTVLPPRGAVDVACWKARNPVAEARWVLRSIKRDLAAGIDPLDVAVILPRGASRAFAALADEYGVPVMDETPRPLVEAPAGRRLADLLALAQTPTAARLLVVPELEPLARATLGVGVAGSAAVDVLAERLGMESAWSAWRDRLAPGGMDWARDLVDLACAAEADAAVADDFRERALQRAQEASALGTGEGFTSWWLALLQEPAPVERPAGGVALLDPVRASGRRFARAYVMGAVAGAYDPGAGEDWFVPEDVRVAWRDVFASPGLRRLPYRLRGSAAAFWADLRSRADELVVTYPEADREGPLEPAAELVRDARSAPAVPAGSRLELATGAGWDAPREAVPLHDPSVERLRRFHTCGFRLWAEDLLGLDPERVRATVAEDDALNPAAPEAPGAAWEALRAGLVGTERHDPATLEALAVAHPDAAGWLSAHAATLADLTYGVRLEAADGAAYARIDAARRDRDTAELYLFTGPGSASTPARAEVLLQDRWTEYWAAGRLLDGYGGRITRVDVHVWPIFEEPVEVFSGGITSSWSRVVRIRRDVDRAYAAFRAGAIDPRPGFICRGCLVADICREAAR